MINLEPSWIEVGDCITRQLAEHFPKGKQRDSLFQTIEQMASIAHHARAEQLRQKLVDGEVSVVPEWVHDIYQLEQKAT